jgi:HEAT repeat protein
MNKKVFYLIYILFILCNGSYAQSQETINKCSKDMESKKAEIRQQAAMILGKYEEPEVTQLLLNHLKDESNLVRRAVLVSLQDRIQKRMISINDMAQIVYLLEDKDVEVRRLASSTAQFFIGLVLRENSFQTTHRMPVSQLTDDQKKIKAIFLKSIQDTDDIVRINNLTTILQNRYLFNDPEYNAAILTRIDDTNKTAIIIALDLTQMINGVDATDIAKKLVDHTDSDVQFALIKFLAQRRFTSAEIWQKLVAKKNLDVASKAISVAFELGINNMDAEYSLFILDATNPVNLRMSLLKQIPLHAKKNELITTLLEDKSNLIRLETIRVCPQVLKPNDLKNLFKKYIDDPDASIQNEAISILFLYLSNLDTELFKIIFKSEKNQIRLGVLEKLEQLKINNDEIILEAMLDDTKAIRLKSFDLCRNFKSANPQIKLMLTRSIEDADPEIRNAALKAIANYVNNAEMLEIYNKLIGTSDAIVKTQIASSLKNFPLEEARPLLNTLAADKDLGVSSQAHLTFYINGETKSAEVLAKNIQSVDLPLSDRIIIQQSIMREKNVVKESFAKLLKDSSEEIRLNSIKFFNLNRDLYQEDYINAIFTETTPLIIQITTEIYISKKFLNVETTKNLLASTNQKVKTLGFRLLAENYKAEYLPILKDLFQLEDPRSTYLSLEIIKKNNISEFDTLIIDKFKGKSDKMLRPYYFWALLTLNTEKALAYIKTIDDKNAFYPDLITAKQSKALDESRQAKPGDKTK